MGGDDRDLFTMGRTGKISDDVETAGLRKDLASDREMKLHGALLGEASNQVRVFS